MNTALTFWVKVPALVRAPVTAMLVLVAAVYPTSFLMQANLATMPDLPWSILPGGLYLWLLWRYIGGFGAPASTASGRKRYRRFHSMPTAGRLWVWLSGIGLAVTIYSYSMIKLLTETGGVQQAAMLDALSELPATTVLPLLAMVVLMTGFFEEAAFRGYMQVQLEERYRPAVAIALTAILFAVIHFPAPGQLPLFIFGSLGWGILTYLTGTIVPAVAMHLAVDGVMFLWAWLKPEEFRDLLEHNVLVTGTDSRFMTWVSVAAIATACTIFGFWKFRTTQNRQEVRP